ncbi:MAG: damage-inducible protein DinB [Phyllobacteriaceae bacterium]|nr:damage-inducible protein DinB [Phyllobacteriaceae bacterium]
MARIDGLRLAADYNAWMNRSIYDAAGRLPAEEVAADRGAFFGSILGTLEHLVVGDTLWLKRFAEHPSGAALAPVRALPRPTALSQIQFGALAPLRERREMLDGLIVAWARSLTESDLDVPLAYRSTRGDAFVKPFELVIQHFFNHQTHHRGQTTTLLTQAGVDVGVTDLLTLIPNV